MTPTWNKNGVVAKCLQWYGQEVLKNLPRINKKSIKNITFQKKATYPSEEPPAPIEEPLFNSAPVQDLTSLAEFDMYEIHTTSTSKPKSISSKVPDHVYYRDHEGYGILYQNTHDSNHLAEEVQSGSVYVQKPQKESETEITPEDDEDLYYIFYDKVGYRDLNFKGFF